VKRDEQSDACQQDKERHQEMAVSNDFFEHRLRRMRPFAIGDDERWRVKSTLTDRNTILSLRDMSIGIRREWGQTFG
jgi:hypothetical protein